MGLPINNPNRRGGTTRFSRNSGPVDWTPPSMDQPFFNHLRATDPAAERANVVVSSEEIFQGQRKVLIEHAGEFYRLQITARNRLLLQKWFVVQNPSNLDDTL